MSELHPLYPVLEWEWAAMIDDDSICLRFVYDPRPLAHTGEKHQSSWFRMTTPQARNLVSVLQEAILKAESLSEARNIDRLH